MIVLRHYYVGIYTYLIIPNTSMQPTQSSQKQKFFERPFVIPSFVLGITLIIGLALVGQGIASKSSGNIISVTGSAVTDVTADTASWSLTLNRTAGTLELTGAYKALSADADAVAKLLTSQNLASSTVTQTVITTNQNYSNQGNPTTYTLSETVTMQTSDVQKIDTLSHNVTQFQNLLSSDTVLSPQSPAYFVSSLPDLRVSLIGKAVADAKARATEIAKSGGSTVGALSSASSGVVQVVAPNSTNVDDYGSYDTSTIQKQVMVTARASFYVR
jgi:hypothetical protein